jgi:hypothetical protein
MHGQYDPVIVYGFVEDEEKSVMDDSWLREECEGFDVFAKDVAKLGLVEAVYGMQAEFDPATGTASISEKDKKKVKKFYARWLESKGIKQPEKKSGSSSKKRKVAEVEEAFPELKFHLCVISYDVDKGEHSEYKLSKANEKVTTKHGQPKKPIRREQAALLQTLMSGRMGMGMGMGMFGGMRF